MKTKLNAEQKHILKLIAKEQSCPDGWAPVSKHVFALVQSMPSELVELCPLSEDGRGIARLTQEGQNVIYAMAWM